MKSINVNWTLVTKRLRPHGQLLNKLDEKVQKLAKHIEHFPPDAVQLQVRIESQPRKTTFDVSLTLQLPSNTLRASKSGPDPIPAVDQAIKVLLREVAVLKAALRHENDWKPPIWRDSPLASNLAPRDSRPSMQA